VRVVAPVTATVGDDDAEATGAAIYEEYAAHILPPERLPGGFGATYSDMAVIRLDTAGTFLTWDNAALVGPA